MTRRCSTATPCKFEDHCKHRQVPFNSSNGFFWVDGTGEQCRHYELHTPSEEEVSQRLIRLAGAHQ